MKKRGKITCFSAFLLCFVVFLASCGNETVSEHAAAGNVLSAAVVAPAFNAGGELQHDNKENYKEEVYSPALAVSAGFGRFVAEVEILGGVSPKNSENSEFKFEILQKQDENFVIDISFPIIDNPSLNSVVQEMVFNRLNTFTAANVEGHIFARSEVFIYGSRVVGVSMDFRSFGNNSGYDAAKYAINFDLVEENFIGLDDIFSEDSDFINILADFAAENLRGHRPDEIELFNFDKENLYLHIDLDKLLSVGASYHTVAIPLDELDKIWQGEVFDASAFHAGYVALTFDDGPNDTFTVELLDALKEAGVPATFFLLGSHVVRHPEIVARMFEEGHQIGNHSFSHPILTNIGRSSAFNEIDSTSTEIENITGVRPTVLRPPYGIQGNPVPDLARDLDMSIILWSVDPRDWMHRDAKIVADHVVNHANDGSVILLHDVHQSSVDAAVMIIERLTAEGYTFVTVEELFQRNAMLLEAGQVYRSIYHTAGSGRSQ